MAATARPTLVPVALVVWALSVVLVETAELPLPRMHLERARRLVALVVLAAWALTQVVTAVLVATHSSMEMHLVLQSEATVRTEVMVKMLVVPVARRVLRPLPGVGRPRTGWRARLELRPTPAQ
jgi:hypothetical protein